MVEWLWLIHGKVIEKTLPGKILTFRRRKVLGIVPTGGVFTLVKLNGDRV